MSFSDLSREIRNIIYHELLCPPDGVHLQHVDWDRRMRKFKADVFPSIHQSGNDNIEEVKTMTCMLAWKGTKLKNGMKSR